MSDTYIGNKPPSNALGLPTIEVKDNVVYDVVTDGTTVNYDIYGLDFPNDHEYVIDISSNIASNPTISIFPDGNMTRTQYRTSYYVGNNGSNLGGGVDSDSYLVADGDGSVLNYTGVVSWNVDGVSPVPYGYTMWQGWTWGYKAPSDRLVGYMGYHTNGTPPPTFLRIVNNDGVTALPAGIHIRVTRRKVQQKDVVYANGQSIQKNYLHNTGNWVNQIGYSYGSSTSAVSERLTDRWLANQAVTSISYSTLSDQELMTIVGGIYQGIERNDLAGKVCVLHWEGTAQASLWRINGDASNFQDSPIVFTMPTDANTAGAMEYVTFGAGTLKHMKLELGEVPTKWEPEDPAQQAIICDRYFERIYAGWGGYVNNTTGYVAPVAFRNTMRATPALVNTIAIDYSNFNTTAPTFFSGRDTGGLLSKVATNTAQHGYWGFELDFDADIK